MSAQATATQAPPRTVQINDAAVTSSALLGQNKELVIVHNDAEYKLRQTATGKLILTK